MSNADYSPFSAELQRDHAEEAQRRREEANEPDPRIDLNAHLEDIVKDVARVRKALNDDMHEPCVDADTVKVHLSIVSNLLDDLYNQIRGI